MTESRSKLYVGYVKGLAKFFGTTQEEREMLYDEGIRSLLNAERSALPHRLWKRRIRLDMLHKRFVKRRPRIRERTLARRGLKAYLKVSGMFHPITYPDLSLEDREEIREVVDCLTPRNQVLLLTLYRTFWKGESKQFCAATLGISPSRLSQRLKEVRSALV